MRMVVGRVYPRAVRLAELHQRHDPVEMLSNNSGNALHRIHPSSHHLCAQLSQQCGHDMNLFADQNLPQVFPVQPGPGNALGRQLCRHDIQVRHRQTAWLGP